MSRHAHETNIVWYVYLGTVKSCKWSLYGKKVEKLLLFYDTICHTSNTFRYEKGNI